MTEFHRHGQRAYELRKLYDNSHRVRTHDLGEEVEALWEQIENADGPGLDAIEVPHRYAVALAEGDETLIVLADSLTEAADDAHMGIFNDYPSAPLVCVDLDTGEQFEPAVRVSFVPQEKMRHARELAVALNAGEGRRAAAARILGIDDEDELTDAFCGEAEGIEWDDDDSDVIDFFGGVLVKRVPREKPTQDALFAWEIETY